eukprot:snap_masked-scaffold_29-processed-gene-1.50-mRNA-1 protein AED:1.00 eAED:1.00 QI:0/-1/0/0/-1/1/1/0/75
MSLELFYTFLESYFKNVKEPESYKTVDFLTVIKTLKFNKTAILVAIYDQIFNAISMINNTTKNRVHTAYMNEENT